jgi:hypothetical protein
VDVPWDPAGCNVEFAGVPANAFPSLEWTEHPGGPPGCDALVKNWDAFSVTGQAIVSARRVKSGHELSLVAVLGDGDTYSLLIGADGRAASAYRSLPSQCTVSRLHFANDGHWIGAQRVSPDVSAFVYQPQGVGPDAATATPITQLSQRQFGLGDLFAAEALFATEVQVFDRSVGLMHTSPPALSATDPCVSEDAVLYARYDAVDDPTIWVWDRGSKTFRELLDGGPLVVGEARASGGTLVWIEHLPYDEKLGKFPPGTLYTSPFSPDPKALVPTARWSNLPVYPASNATIGDGYYAIVSETTRLLYILRLSDGRRWEVPIPNDEFQSPVQSMAYIDDQVLFFSTETQIYRLRLDAIGEGLPAE